MKDSDKPTKDDLVIIKRFLQYALCDVNFNYDELTKEERMLATPDEFRRLVNWVRG